MLISEKDIKMRFSVSERMFYLYGDGKFSERCFIYDTIEECIHQEDLSISEGMKSLTELSALFPRRFVLVFDDAFDNDEIPF